MQTYRFALTALSASLVLCASLVACGDDEEDPEPDAGPEAGSAGSAGAGAGTGAGEGGSSGTGAGSGGSSGAAGSAGSSGSDAGDAGMGLLGVSCDEAEIEDATRVLDNDLVGSDVTLEGLVHVTETIYLYDGTITIEPGTTFIMDADTSFEIGWNSNDATVIAEGTEELPIRFCGAEATPGFWGFVGVGNAVTSDSVLEHVEIHHAGGEREALLLEAGVRVTNVLVADSGSDGVRASRFARGSEGLSVTGADGIAVLLTHAVALNDLPIGGTIEDNGEDTIHLTFDSIQNDVTVKAADVPYVQEEEIIVYDIELVFEAGVDYRFGADAFLDIGWNSRATELHIEGEESAPVVFQGAVDTKGYYRGIRINAEVPSSSTITYAEIRHGGGLDTPALDIFARITLQNVTLEDNLLGMRLERPLQEASSDLTITGTDAVPLRVHPSAMTGIPTGGSFTGNDEDEIVVEDALSVLTVTGLVPDLGVPFRIASDIELDDGSDVEIAPGTEFVMAADTTLLVGWNSNPAKLTAVGTSAEPIVFMGESDTAGYWDGIVLTSSADATSELEYVTIQNAGKAGSAALTLERAISVTNTTIDSSAGAGIEKADTDATDYTVSNTFTDVAEGNVISN